MRGELKSLQGRHQKFRKLNYLLSAASSAGFARLLCRCVIFPAPRFILPAPFVYTAFAYIVYVVKGLLSRARVGVIPPRQQLFSSICAGIYDHTPRLCILSSRRFSYLAAVAPAAAPVVLCSLFATHCSPISCTTHACPHLHAPRRQPRPSQQNQNGDSTCSLRLAQI